MTLRITHKDYNFKVKFNFYLSLWEIIFLHLYLKDTMIKGINMEKWCHFYPDPSVKSTRRKMNSRKFLTA